MSKFQGLLLFITGILFSRGLFIFWEAIVVHKKSKKFLYFSLSALVGALYIFLEMLMASPKPDNVILIMHRFKILSLLISLNFWVKSVYCEYFPKSFVPVVFHIISIIFAVFIPTNLFISGPVTYHNVMWHNISFDYRFGETHLVYTLMSLSILTVYVFISIPKFIKSDLSFKQKIGGIIAFLPGFVCFNDFFVSQGFSNNIMISEYAVFCFIFSMSFLFIKINGKTLFRLEQSNYKIREYSDHLEEMIAIKTAKIEEDKKRKTTFFVNFTHELKTPLTLITNYFNEYVKNRALSPELKIIEANLNKLKRDVSNFLDVEKVEQNKKLYNHNSVVCFSDVLEQNLQLFRSLGESRKIDIHTNITRGLHSQIDPSAADRIINNLIDNAIKYNIEGGEIVITLERKMDRLFFQVKDSGVGIPLDGREHLYEPYHQLDTSRRTSNGLGMGLYIVKSILSSIGGHIAVESIPGQGASFVIDLPLYVRKENDSRCLPPVESPGVTQFYDLVLKDSRYDEKKKTILFIEDQQNLLSYLLESFRHDYNVYFAVNGEEALTKLCIMPHPDIIISDLMMDCMDGYEFYSKLKTMEEYSDVPIIFLTAKTGDGEKLKGFKLGAVDYISKPFDMEILKTRINNLFSLKNEIQSSTMKELTSRVMDAIINKEDHVKTHEVSIKHKMDDYSFTCREQDIFEYLKMGKSNKEIAFAQQMSLSTVKRHIHNIYKKMGVNTRLEFSNCIYDNQTVS